MKGVIAYVLSKKYTNDSLIGMGALKGANCKVKDVVKTDKTTTVTLSWKDDLDVDHDTDFEILDGLDGVDVVSATISNTYHLVLTLSDGNTIDAGVISDKVTSMPTASSDNVGMVNQFVGTTYSNYTHGYFYECVEDSGVYKWERIDVQPNIIESVNGKTGVVELNAEDVGALSDDTVIPTKTSELTNDSNFVNEDDLATKQDIIQYETLPTASETLVKKIVQYIGETTDNYHNGYFYQCVADEVEQGQPQTYSWIAKLVQQGGGSSSYTAGSGIDITNDIISTKLDPNGAVHVSSDGLNINTDNESIEIDNNELKAKIDTSGGLETSADGIGVKAGNAIDVDNNGVNVLTKLNGGIISDPNGSGLMLDDSYFSKLIDTPLTEAQILNFVVENVNKEVNGFFYNSDINAYCSFSGLYMSKTTSGTEVHYGYCNIRGIHETEYLIDYRIDWEDSDNWYKVKIVTDSDLDDVYTKTETDDLLDDKADESDVDLIADTLNVKKWNQIIKNGNFVDTSNWGQHGGSITAENNILTFVQSGSDIQIIQSKNLMNNHKYFCSFTAKSNSDSLGLTVDNVSSSPRLALICDNEWHTCETIFTANNDYTASSNPYFYGLGSVGSTVQIKNVFIVDLTELYGAGNEPTAEKFKKMFPNEYYDYNAGTDINGVVSNLAINKTDLEALKAKIPNPPSNDGKYFLQVFVDNGVATYSWNTLQWTEV